MKVVAHLQSGLFPGKALCGQEPTTLEPCPKCQSVLATLLKVHVSMSHAAGAANVTAYCGLPLLRDGLACESRRYVTRERALEVVAFAEANPGLVEPCFCEICADKADRAIAMEEAMRNGADALAVLRDAADADRAAAEVTREQRAQPEEPRVACKQCGKPFTQNGSESDECTVGVCCNCEHPPGMFDKFDDDDELDDPENALPPS